MDDVITQAMRAAHQAALDNDLRVKKSLAKIGLSADDFAIMDRYSLADFARSIRRSPNKTE